MFYCFAQDVFYTSAVNECNRRNRRAQRIYEKSLRQKFGVPEGSDGAGGDPDEDDDHFHGNDLGEFES